MFQKMKVNESPYFLFSILFHALLLLVFSITNTKSISLSRLEKTPSPSSFIQAEVRLKEPDKSPKKKYDISKKLSKPADSLVTKRLEKKVLEDKQVSEDITKTKKTSLSVDFTKSNQNAPKELSAFFNALIEEINIKTKYPRISKRMRETGIVHVKFRIDSQGRVLKSNIHKGCEYDRLNESALKVVSMLELKKLPPENYPEIEITFPLSYNL